MDFYIFVLGFLGSCILYDFIMEKYEKLLWDFVVAIIMFIAGLFYFPELFSMIPIK